MLLRPRTRTIKEVVDLLHQFLFFRCDLHTNVAPCKDIVGKALESLFDHVLPRRKLSAPCVSGPAYLLCRQDMDLIVPGQVMYTFEYIVKTRIVGGGGRLLRDTLSNIRLKRQT